MYVIFLKSVLLSGKKKMVTSGYETKYVTYKCFQNMQNVLGWNGLRVLLNIFIQFGFWLLNLTNIPDASLTQ